MSLLSVALHKGLVLMSDGVTRTHVPHRWRKEVLYRKKVLDQLGRKSDCPEALGCDTHFLTLGAHLGRFSRTCT